MRLTGKVALISGAARGIGAAIARACAAEGAKVIVGDVLEAAGQSLANELMSAGKEALFVHLDVTSEADWQQAVAVSVERFEALHILVNNAGTGVPGKLEEVSLAEWRRVMEVNATGVFLGTKAALAALRQAGGGSIVNISSQLGLVGVDSSSPQYQASKGAVRLLTKSTAIQYASEGIRVNSVHPGPIVTARTAAQRADPQRLATTLSRIPLGRYGQSEEVAYGVVYLASDEASFVTGSELVIDGGWTAQ